MPIQSKTQQACKKENAGKEEEQIRGQKWRRIQQQNNKVGAAGGRFHGTVHCAPASMEAAQSFSHENIYICIYVYASKKSKRVAIYWVVWGTAAGKEEA